MSLLTRAGRRVPALAAALLAMLTVAVLAAPSGGVLAQDAVTLASSVPGNGSTIKETPTELTFTFTGQIRGNQKFEVALACNNAITLGEPDLSSDRLTFTVPITGVVPRGPCIAQWKLKDADDVELLSNLVTFTVDADPPVPDSTPDSTTTTVVAASTATAGATDAATPTDAETPTDAAAPPASGSGGTIWFGRLLSMVGIMALFGGVSMIAIGWREGPEYVLTARYLRAVWVVAFLGAFITIVAVAADATGSSFGGGLSPAAWFDATSTWPGRSALMAFVLVIASASVAYAPERITDPATAPWAWGLPALALFALSIIRVGGPLAPFGVLFNLVHLFGAAICFGGAALVFRAVLAGAGGDDLIVATRTFSRAAIPALLITVVTGFIQMLRLDGTSLFGSGHGRVVLLKILLVGGLGVLIFGVRNQVAMRLDHTHEISEATASRLRRPFFAEAGLGAVILALSAWMLALTPPALDPLQSATYTITIPIDDSTTGLKAVAYFGPGKVGKNGFKLEVSEPASGISSLVITFIPPTGTSLEEIEQTIPLTGAGTAYRVQSDGFPFDAAGEWTMKVAATTTQGTQPGALFPLTIIGATTDTPVSVTTTTVAGAVDPNASTTTVASEVSLVQETTTTAAFAGG